MAGRSAHTRRASQESHPPPQMLRAPDGRRSLSHDDTPRPAGALQGSNNPTADVVPAGEHAHTTKRLGFLGEKLLSTTAGATSSAQRASPIPPPPLPSRSHSRVESALNLINITRESPLPPIQNMATSPSTQAKGHTSPSKASGTRTYDAKLVSREMHRLGTLAHLPSLNPTLSTAPSTVSLAMAPSVSSISSTSSADNPWTALHVHVLPLFNGEPLRVPIEDLNTLVKRHIQTVVSAAPSRALATLEHDASLLIASGMVTLNAKLSGAKEDKLIARVVELWGFFWDQVLPYVEGALLPLQTDPLLLSLHRTPKTHKPSSPVAQGSKGSISSPYALNSTPQIDVRTVALQSFRDNIIYPAYPALNARLTMAREQSWGSPGYQQPRLQQMLLVLVSQRSLTLSFSLTEPPPPPPPSEAAIQHLLRTIRTPITQLSPDVPTYHPAGTGAPSFLSAGLPRDRRGRIAHKVDRRDRRARDWGVGLAEEGDSGGETPRMGTTFADPTRDREREFLESLRSPDPENARASMGGWGLGAGSEDRKVEEDDEDDGLDWDQAQVLVERMVGLKTDGPPTPLPEGRRRMT